MFRSIVFTIAILAIVVSFAPSKAFAQIDTQNSYYLLQSSSSTNLTVNTISGGSYSVQISPYSNDIPLRSLTDIKNKRFIILSALADNDASTVTYSISYISYLNKSVSLIGSFALASDISVKDFTYDHSVPCPILLLHNTTDGVCNLMALNSTNLASSEIIPVVQNCSTIRSIASVIRESQVLTISPQGSNTQLCIATPGNAPYSCTTKQGVVIANAQASARPRLFGVVYTQDGAPQVGQLAVNFNIRSIALLELGSAQANFQNPSYWDPVNSIMVGAWKTQTGNIQLYAVTMPLGSFLVPKSLPAPPDTLLSLALSYKPVHNPPTSVPVFVPVRQSNDTGMIVGIVIGVLAAIGLIGGVIFFTRRRLSFYQYRKL